MNSNKEDWSLLATETVMVVVVAKNNFTGDIGCHQLVVNVDDPLTIVLLQQLSSFSANFFDIFSMYTRRDPVCCLRPCVCLS